MLVAVPRRLVHQRVIHRHGQLFVNRAQLATLDAVEQRRVLIKFEQIDRQMIRRERKRLLQVALPSLHPLLGQTRDQVETDVGKAGLTR